MGFCYFIFYIAAFKIKIIISMQLNIKSFINVCFHGCFHFHGGGWLILLITGIIRDYITEIKWIFPYNFFLIKFSFFYDGEKSIDDNN